jgi:hypothetical protein
MHNLKEGKIFGGITVSVHGLLAPLLWAMVREKIMAGAGGGAKLLTSWLPGSRESQRQEVAGNKIVPPGHAPNDLTSSSRPHLLSAYCFPIAQ